MAKVYESPIIEIEPDENHGNTKLPYGIAKGYGLDTTGKTPREVWDMLKGYGVTPENEYKKLKEKAEEKIEDNPEVVDANKEVRKKQIQTISGHIDTKLKDFSDNTKTQLKSTIEKLDDSEVAFIERTIQNMNIMKGNGGVCYGEGKIMAPDGNGTPIDHNLGYNFNARSFYHEYGHSVAETIGRKIIGEDNKLSSSAYWGYDKDFNHSVDMQDVFREDYHDLMEKIGKEAGITKEFNPNRITEEYKEAFMNVMANACDKEYADMEEPIEPTSSQMTYEMFDKFRSIHWLYRDEWKTLDDKTKQAIWKNNGTKKAKNIKKN